MVLLSLPCLVEDFVFTNKGDNLGINYTSGELVYAGLNTLYSEVNWFYPKDGSSVVDELLHITTMKTLGRQGH